VVDQDNVEGAVGAIDRFHRVAEFVARDSVVAACSQVLAGEFEFVLVDLGEDDLAVRGKGVGDPVGGVAVARSELEDALGVAQSGDEPEERADRRANVGNPLRRRTRPSRSGFRRDPGRRRERSWRSRP